MVIDFFILDSSLDPFNVCKPIPMSNLHASYDPNLDGFLTNSAKAWHHNFQMVYSL